MSDEIDSKDPSEVLRALLLSLKCDNIDFFMENLTVSGATYLGNKIMSELKERIRECSELQGKLNTIRIIIGPMP